MLMWLKVLGSRGTSNEVVQINMLDHNLAHDLMVFVEEVANMVEVVDSPPIV